MAKAPSPKAPGTSRIRFVMVEAEISDAGDLNQVTQAIQNALRPSTTPVRLSGPAPARANGATPPPSPAVVDVEGEEVADQEVEAAEEEATREATPRTARKPAQPKVLELDLGGEPPFTEFAAEKNPPSHMMRYLTVAAWFKLYKQVNPITVHHVYTCYRHVKWPLDVGDWGQPLRDLKRQQYLGGESRGQYEINQLGLQQIENLPKQ